MIQPKLEEIINDALSTFQRGLHTCTPGVIEKYDPGTCTASCSFGNQKFYRDEEDTKYVFEKYPILYNVPVLFGSGGNVRITLPLKAGDPCLLIFSEDDLNNYRGNGAKDNTPAYAGRHTIAGAICIPVNIREIRYGGGYTDAEAVVVSGGGTPDFVPLNGLLQGELSRIKNDISQIKSQLLVVSGQADTGASPAPPVTSAVTTALALVPSDPGNTSSTKLKAE